MTGNEKKVSTGFTMAFTIPKTSATPRKPIQPPW